MHSVIPLIGCVCRTRRRPLQSLKADTDRDSATVCHRSDKSALGHPLIGCAPLPQFYESTRPRLGSMLCVLLRLKSVHTVFRFLSFLSVCFSHSFFCLRACMHLSISLSSYLCVCVFLSVPLIALRRSALSPSLLSLPPFLSPSFCRYPHRTWDGQEAKDDANGQCRCQLAGLERAKGKANALRPFPHSTNHRFKHSPLKITHTLSSVFCDVFLC